MGRYKGDALNLYVNKRLKYFLLKTAIFFFSLACVSPIFAQDLDFAADENNPPSTVSSNKLTPGESATQSTIVNMRSNFQRKRWSPWSASYFNWATQDMDKTRLGTAQLNMYNFVSFNYRLRRSSFSIRPVFNIKSAGNDYRDQFQDASIELGDIYLQYAKYDLALLFGDIGLRGAFRVYLPTSTISKNEKQLLEIRTKLIFKKIHGFGWSTEYVFEPKYSIHSARGHVSEFGNPIANKWGELRHYFETTKMFNPDFGVSASMGMKHQAYYNWDSEHVQNHFNDYLESGVNVVFNLGAANFKLGVLNSIDVRRPNSKYATPGPFQLFKEQDNQYSLMTYVRF